MKLYRLLPILFSLITCQLFAQKLPTFSIGVQSGVNFTITNIQESTPLKGGWIPGYSCGVIAQHQLTSFIWRFANFRNTLQVHLEYGINFSTIGYDYGYFDKNVAKRSINWEVPVFLTIIGDNRLYPRSWRKQKIFPVGKLGWALNLPSNLNYTGRFEQNATDYLIEKTSGTTQIHHYFIGAVGFQRQLRYGRSSYFGVSMHVGLRPLRASEITVVQSGRLEEFSYTSLGNYFSFDLQYFFGKMKNSIQDSKTIYNPKFL